MPATAAGEPASRGPAFIAPPPGRLRSRFTADCAPLRNSATLPRALFEIGNSLREARVRRGIEFAQAELATKIRGKYLRALEEEHFEVLPAQTYVKGFLRSYAEYLGLDGQLYVDEFNSRYVVGEDEPPIRARRTVRPRRHRRVQSRVLLAALVGIALVTALVIAAWKSSPSKQNVVGAAPTGKPAHDATRPHGPASITLRGV